MDLYTAFMRTADRIQRNHGCCHLVETDIPQKNTDKGCVLGWVAFELGWSPLLHAHADDVLSLMGLEHFTDFSTRMLAIHDKIPIDVDRPHIWYRSPPTIRAYANKYLLRSKRDPGVAKIIEKLDSRIATSIV